MLGHATWGAVSCAGLSEETMQLHKACSEEYWPALDCLLCTKTRAEKQYVAGACQLDDANTITVAHWLTGGACHKAAHMHRHGDRHDDLQRCNCLRGAPHQGMWHDVSSACIKSALDWNELMSRGCRLGNSTLVTATCTRPEQRSWMSSGRTDSRVRSTTDLNLHRYLMMQAGELTF